MRHAVELRDVVKSFGRNQALRGVSFRVPKGCIAGLVGPNGAGKTTTLRVIVGALARDYGSVEVLGTDPWVNPRYVRSVTGYLPEVPRLPSVRVAHLLGHVARLKGVKEVRKEIIRVARLTKITQVLDSTASRLSTGWRQRVALAVALLGNVELLVLDEPASNVDPEGREEFYNLLKVLRDDQGVTALVSTHILAEAQKYADYLVIINSGVIVAEGSTADLVSIAGSRVKLVFKGRSETLLREAAKDAVMLRGVISIEVEGNTLKVTAEYGVQEKVREVVEGRGLTLVEALAGDLTDLYRRLIHGKGG